MDIQNRGVNWVVLKEEVDTIDREEFLQRYPNPFLVVMQRDSNLEDDPLYQILRPGGGGIDTVGDEANKLGLKLTRMVYYIPFGIGETGDKVKIGRAERCEVCLLLPGISKNHSVLIRDPEKNTVYIEDAESTNGTMIAGKKLDKGQREVLKAGAQIGLSKSVLANFVGPGTLYRLLKSL